MSRQLVEIGPGAPEGPVSVVHLVRAMNGLDAFRAFLAALRANPPGTDHRLVLAMKGFASKDAAAPYLAEAGDLDPEPLFFDDTGYDLGVYLQAAGRLRGARYCFLNSFSEPLHEGWLERLQAPVLDDPGVGLAGATGSWNSPRSWTLHALGLPTPYRGVLPGRRVVRSQLAAMQAEQSSGPSGSRGRARPLATAARTLAEMPAQARDYEGFPAHHVRTNAFVLAHETLMRLRLPEVRTKRDAYMLEAGRDSLTRQVQRLGMRAVVVDRGGDVYEQEEWDRSATFWQRRQEGLLLADNQTRAYSRGAIERRRLLAAMAWGARAEALPEASA